MAVRVVTAPVETPQAIAVSEIALSLGTTDLPAVAALVERVTSLVERTSNLKLWYRDYEEVIEGDGTDRLYLSARPIISISEVIPFGGAAGEALAEGTEADEYQIWSSQGYLEREDLWCSGRPFWKVTYAGGFWIPSMGSTVTGTALSDGASDLAGAIRDIVTLQWQIDSGDRRIKSARLSSMAVEYDNGLVVPKMADMVLRNYRRFTI